MTNPAPVVVSVTNPVPVVADATALEPDSATADATALEPDTATADATVPAEDVDEPVEQAVVVPGFERFKTIMDRSPFGRPPPGFDPDSPGGLSDVRNGAGDGAETAAEASVVEQQIISSVRVSVLNVTPSGKIHVGFTDSSVQPPRNYLLEVGEKREGCEWQVVDADPEKLTARLSKDGVEATLLLGGGSGAPDAKKEGEEAAKGPGAGPMSGPGPGSRSGMMFGLRRPPMLVGAGPAAAGAPPPGDAMEGMSGLDVARARRQERLKQMQVEAEQQRQAAEQAKRDREQERQEREQAAEERKAQLAQLMQIQEELRRQREEKEKAAAEAARQAAESPPPQSPQQQEPQQQEPQQQEPQD